MRYLIPLAESVYKLNLLGLSIGFKWSFIGQRMLYLIEFVKFNVDRLANFKTYLLRFIMGFIWLLWSFIGSNSLYLTNTIYWADMAFLKVAIIIR
jgi:hypothetical protein